MRKESGLSLELERSMNLQCNIMTFEEVLRNSAAVDKLDDVRRKKLYDVIDWNLEMQQHFLKILKTLNIKLHSNELKKLIDDMTSHKEKFKNSLIKLKREDYEYEKVDDDNRNFLIYYAAGCREQLRKVNSEVETKLMLENIEMKARKKI